MADITTPGTDKNTEGSTFRRAVTGRAVAVGLIGIPITIFIVAWAELVTGTIQIGFLQLPPILIVLLLLLTVINRILGRLNERWRLTAPEIVVAYCMMLMASMVISRGVMEDLLPIQIGLNYFANEANKWQELYFGHIQQWMVPWNPDGSALQPVAVGYFEGLRPGANIPWRQWLPSTAAWLALILMVHGAFLAMASFLQKLWADDELLSFPLVQLPLEMIQPRQGKDFLKNKVVWFGFALPMFVFTLNGLHQLYPQLPQIRLNIPLGQYLSGRPWNAIGYFRLFPSMAAVGFFYLLPSEVLLSLWFFYLFARFQSVVAASFGVNLQGAPHSAAKMFIAYQNAGAYIGLVAFMLWTSWPRIREMIESATGRGDSADRNELMPYSTALGVLAIAFIGIVAMSGAAGMSLWVGLVEFGLYLFVQAIVMARSTAEAGMPMTEGSFTPLDVIGAFTHKRSVGPANLTALAFTDCLFARDLRGMVLTGFLDGQKLGDEVGVRRRSLLPIFIGAIVISIVLAFAISLYLPYKNGGVTMYRYVYSQVPTQFWRENAPHMMGQESFKWRYPVWLAVGVLVSLGLSSLRHNFVGWPLGPLGYALSGAWTTTVFWFPMLVAWLIKTAVTHYGGITIYRRARPFFLGLIFGEFTMAAFWTIFSCINRTPAPFFPWP